MTEPYTCAVCGNTYLKTWTDEEAFAETRELFPIDVERGNPLEVICDDCFRSLVTQERVAQYNKEL